MLFFLFRLKIYSKNMKSLKNLLMKNEKYIF